MAISFRAISRKEVKEIFESVMPPDVDVIFIDHAEYIAKARNHPFVKAQIMAGIYTEESLENEFLSPACSYVSQGRVEVDLDLLQHLMKGVSLRHTKSWVKKTALHEAHHFEASHDPRLDVDGLRKQEVSCEEAVRRDNPSLFAAAEEAEARSRSFQRVYDRIKARRESLRV